MPRVSPGLDRQAWVEAAYERFAELGVEGVRVEPLARALGATKGSFYWHFTDRADLVAAVLDRWADDNEAVIAAVTGSTPEQRLRSLFQTVDTARIGGRGEALLYGQADDPVIAAALDRVTARRLAVVTDILRDSGFSRVEARRRAALALATALGHQQLALARVPSAGASGADRRATVDLLTRSLLAPAPR